MTMLRGRAAHPHHASPTPQPMRPMQCAAAPPEYVGPPLWEEPVLNYSPCCVHYRESCCELHARSECPAPNEVEGIKVAGRTVAGRKEAGIASSAKGEVSSAKGEVCGELLGLLACARCSPVSANFTRPTGELVLCASFCRYLVFTRPRILHRKRSNQPQTPQIWRSPPQRSPIPTILSLFSLHQESTL